MQTERDRYQETAHYRLSAAVQAVRKWLALAFPWLTQVITSGNRVAVTQDGEKSILMEDIKIDELNVILKETLRAVGFGTATVRAQRYNDDAIPSNWDRSDMITYGKEDPDEVEAMLSRIIPDLQVKYRI
jgi:hypothetical protein